MTDPAVTDDDVRRVAELARVDLDDERIEDYRQDFTDILEHFAKLEEVPDRDWDEPIEDVLRADEIKESLEAEVAIENAPETEDGYFKGPPVS